MTLKPIFFRSLLTLVMLGLLAAQCGSQTGATPPAGTAGAGSGPLAPVSLANGEKLKVVATTTIVADIVHQVGDDLIELTTLLPVGSDPHSFQATPRDLTNVAKADVIFANGMGLEKFLDEMLKNAGGAAALVELSAGITGRPMTELVDTGHQAGSELDPHTWLSPVNVLTFVDNIEQALAALDPANAAAYRANAVAYKGQLTELDGWIKGQIETIPPENRKLVTDHAIFGYYADRYGLEQIGAVIPAVTTAAEPSAQELTRLENAIRQYGVKAVFVGNTVNPALSKQVAQDTGIQLLTVYTGSLGPAGSGAATYLDYMRYNTNTIVKGLQ